MKKKDNLPLRLIIQKFIGSSITTEESIHIIHFLTSYSNVEEGATHLFQENILHSIGINNCLALVNKQELYVVQDGETKRNPTHILWCSVLLLIRTLNEQLINSPDYLRSLIKQIRSFEHRLLSVLGVGKQYSQEESSSGGQI